MAREWRGACVSLTLTSSFYRRHARHPQPQAHANHEKDDIPCLVPLCTPGLPPLVYHSSIVRLACRTKPNPTGSGPPSIPAPSTSHPVHDTVTVVDTIVLFDLFIEGANPHAGLFRFPETRSFTFTVHRRYEGFLIDKERILGLEV